MSKRPSRLGRGLSSLMGQNPIVTTLNPVAIKPEGGIAVVQPAHSDDHAATGGSSEEGLRHIPVAQISANPYQPRKNFDPAALQHLADSIKQEGLMQPVVVRPKPGSAEFAGSGGAKAPGHVEYELVAGERRWRAAKLAGLTALPAIVRHLDDRHVAEWALIENLQREDLNVIERAKAFAQLAQQFALSHDQIAQQVGVERSTITNALRLLSLQPDVQQLVIDDMLSGGQAKALAGLADPKRQLELAQRAIKGEWSVRQVEAAVRNLLEQPAGGSASASDKAPAGRAAHLKDLEEQIAQQLNTRVSIRPGRKKGTGTLAIEFYSLDQFDTLLDRLSVKAE